MFVKSVDSRKLAVQVRLCKLCLKTKELRDSHYLPKRLYAYTRAPEMKNPNPVVISQGELKQVSDQLRGHVFCNDCEIKLNEDGEKWVLANIPHQYDEPFLLHDALEPLTPIGFGDGLNVYDLNGTAGFDLARLIYFGISTFWRGSAHEWKSTLGVPAPSVSLGGNEEALRKFVFGTNPLPNEVVITLDIWPYQKVLIVAYPPQEAHLAECRRYWFYVPGLVYALHFGPTIPTSIRDRDLRNGIVGVDRLAGDSVLEFTKEKIKAVPKGPKFDAMIEEIASIRVKKNTE
jgi:hypothetical protein